jgi:HEAT repeat protein
MEENSGAPPEVSVATQERRAAIAIAAAHGDEATVRSGLADPVDAIRAAAVRGLVRMGCAQPDDVAAAIGDRSPVVRRAICELASRLDGGGFASLLVDPVPGVVETAAFAVGEIGDRGAVDALGVVATSHADPLCREAAVAALGAIGDPRGKPAVLRALGDTSYIRRRAVVALAAFSGRDVEDALEAHRNDRDWQVRQAVEDVIGINRQIGE